MYFIARNNKIYDYIAHMSRIRRYMLTFGVIAVFFTVGYYCIYSPLANYNCVYRKERAVLEKRDAELIDIVKKQTNLSMLIEENKNAFNIHAVSVQKHQDSCYARILFILDTLTALGLKLNTYTLSTEKDKKWYVKTKVHCDAIGSQDKIMAFLKAIQSAGSMITMSDVIITRVDNTLFQMSADMGLLSVKK